MSKQSFICPKCREETLSVDNGDSILKEGLSNPLVKKLMSENKMKEYRFWRCKKCSIYYQTDLDGKLLKRFPIRKP